MQTRSPLLLLLRETNIGHTCEHLLVRWVLLHSVFWLYGLREHWVILSRILPSKHIKSHGLNLVTLQNTKVISVLATHELLLELESPKVTSHVDLS